MRQACCCTMRRKHLICERTPAFPNWPCVQRSWTCHSQGFYERIQGSTLTPRRSRVQRAPVPVARQSWHDPRRDAAFPASYPWPERFGCIHPKMLCWPPSNGWVGTILGTVQIRQRRLSPLQGCYKVEGTGDEWSGREDLNLRPPGPELDGHLLKTKGN